MNYRNAKLIGINIGGWNGTKAEKLTGHFIFPTATHPNDQFITIDAGDLAPGMNIKWLAAEDALREEFQRTSEK